MYPCAKSGYGRTLWRTGTEGSGAFAMIKELCRCTRSGAIRLIIRSCAQRIRTEAAVLEETLEAVRAACRSSL